MGDTHWLSKSGGKTKSKLTKKLGEKKKPAAFTVRRSDLGPKEVKALMFGVSINASGNRQRVLMALKQSLASPTRSAARKMQIDAREALRKTSCGFIVLSSDAINDTEKIKDIKYGTDAIGDESVSRNADGVVVTCGTY